MEGITAQVEWVAFEHRWTVGVASDARSRNLGIIAAESVLLSSLFLLELLEVE